MNSKDYKIGYEEDEKNQRRSKLHLPFKLQCKKESSVRTLGRKIQQFYLAFELYNTKEIDIQTQENWVTIVQTLCAAFELWTGIYNLAFER